MKVLKLVVLKIVLTTLCMMLDTHFLVILAQGTTLTEVHEPCKPNIREKGNWRGGWI